MLIQIEPPVTHRTAINRARWMTLEIQKEWLKCYVDVRYFAMRYGWLYNATARAWLPFTLWPAQMTTLRRMADERMLVVLKARQLGISWLSLAYALWLLLFHAPATVLLFSLREAEAVELLGRLKQMHERLPKWMQVRRVLRAGGKEWVLSNGSRALAFSTKGGRSHTGTLAIVDEADFVPELSSFLNGVKPTIDAGGKLFLISTSDKSRPVSTFKNLFRAAVEGVGDYKPVFLPWSARPGRDVSWHERTKAEMFAQRGTNDDFYAEYPATVEEALAPEELDRRLPYSWVKLVTEEALALSEAEGPAVPGLTVYLKPEPGRRYVIGADPAEGNPNSDDSAAIVLEEESWGEVANLVGKLEPSVFASHIGEVSEYYNGADALVERNNHGHTVILKLREDGKARVLNGYDGKPGWLNNIKGKPMLYDSVAEAIRDQACIVRSKKTAGQLASIEASTLSAPEGLMDDCAMAFCLGLAALAFGYSKAQASTSIAPSDPLADIDKEKF